MGKDKEKEKDEVGSPESEGEQNRLCEVALSLEKEFAMLRVSGMVPVRVGGWGWS